MKGIESLPDGAEIKGIPVEYDPYYSGVARAAGIWPLKSIIVGARFMMLDAEVQAAVLLHEVHHCRAMHLEIRCLLLPFCWSGWARRIGRQQELDADIYAARQGYASELMRFIAESPVAHAPFHPSPLERLNNLVALGDAA